MKTRKRRGGKLVVIGNQWGISLDSKKGDPTTDSYRALELKVFIDLSTPITLPNSTEVLRASILVQRYRALCESCTTDIEYNFLNDLKKNIRKIIKLRTLAATEHFKENETAQEEVDRLGHEGRLELWRSNYVAINELFQQLRKRLKKPFEVDTDILTNDKLSIVKKKELVTKNLQLVVQDISSIDTKFSLVPFSDLQVDIKEIIKKIYELQTYVAEMPDGILNSLTEIVKKTNDIQTLIEKGGIKSNEIHDTLDTILFMFETRLPRAVEVTNAFIKTVKVFSFSSKIPEINRFSESLEQFIREIEAEMKSSREALESKKMKLEGILLHIKEEERQLLLEEEEETRLEKEETRLEKEEPPYLGAEKPARQENEETEDKALENAIRLAENEKLSNQSQKAQESILISLTEDHDFLKQFEASKSVFNATRHKLSVLTTKLQEIGDIIGQDILDSIYELYNDMKKTPESDTLIKTKQELDTLLEQLKTGLTQEDRLIVDKLPDIIKDILKLKTFYDKQKEKLDSDKPKADSIIAKVKHAISLRNKSNGNQVELTRMEIQEKTEQMTELVKTLKTLTSKYDDGTKIKIRTMADFIRQVLELPSDEKLGKVAEELVGKINKIKKSLEPTLSKDDIQQIEEYIRDIRMIKRNIIKLNEKMRQSARGGKYKKKTRKNNIK